MAQNEPRSNLCKALVARNKRFREIGCEGNVQPQLPLLHQFQNSIGKHWLTQRSRFKNCLRGHRLARFHLLHPKTVQPNRLSAANYGNRQPRHAVFFHQFRNLSLQLRNRRLGGCRWCLVCPPNRRKNRQTDNGSPKHNSSSRSQPQAIHWCLQSCSEPIDIDEPEGLRLDTPVSGTTRDLALLFRAAGHSLRSDLSAPPPALQIFATG